MIEVLEAVCRHLELSVESAYADTPQRVITVLEREISSLRSDGRFKDVNELKLLFLPTSDIQEISISSGWTERYLELSTRFDNALDS